MGEIASERVVILGAGRVATHLAPALMEVGCNITQIWSRTLVSAQQLAEPLGVSYTNNLNEIATDADVYILCVSDEALPFVSEKLVAIVGQRPLYLHTAGSVGLDLWHRCGALHYGILYPLQTFSKERAVDMGGVSFFVEASDEDATGKVEALGHRLSSKVFRADSKRRARLHIAAVFACNFTNAMYNAASRLLADEGIPFDVLLPLIDETASKVHSLTPYDAQTGPAVRGDKVVMRNHMVALEGDSELCEIYERISNYISRNR